MTQTKTWNWTRTADVVEGVGIGQKAVAILISKRQSCALKMSIDQHNKVPKRVKSMISVPIPGNVHVFDNGTGSTDRNAIS